MTQKITLTISGMHCTSCAMTIDGDLEDLVSGVASATTNYVKAETEVTFDEDKTDVAKIIAQIKKTGYRATSKK